MATAERKAQKIGLCVLHFGTFLGRSLQNNVKGPNSTFCGECERSTVNFPLFI